MRSTATSWAATHRIPVVVRSVPFAATPGEAAETTRLLLAEDPAIDAVICGPDGAAPGVLGAAIAAGRAVGRDFLVASCVDGVATRTSHPPITAIDLRPADYGRACSALLCDILADRTPADAIRHHDWALGTRASTRPG
ncbi:substrate-binding domain-containing protein [Streptomyces sp. ICBB 8177]|uniref:substrate-binding domain-containing protein n=1 Tax=Streptomyces sp. ICBB 8177 TaxID=563922 RepID=UPI000D684D0A|nr:hypothetical protein CK485_08045 [Streptomyces sp. ICBB 8177]